MATSAQEKKRLAGLLLHRFDIGICESEDLLVLSEYDLVVIADDSGSMGLQSIAHHLREPGVRGKSRWEELRETLEVLIEIATCIDTDGVDVHFLNKGSVRNITSVKDAALESVLARGPGGGTPLSETVQRVLAEREESNKPVLMVILTDGEPSGGPHRFKQVVSNAIAQGNVKFQIMACTGEEREMAWLNDFDAAFDEVDVTDDYHSERLEVLRAGRYKTFNRGDWIMKALLGPVVKSYDAADEAPAAAGPFGMGSTKAGSASAGSFGSVQRNALRAGRGGSGSGAHGSAKEVSLEGPAKNVQCGCAIS